MNQDEYLKLAAVEDEMWYFHALHAQFARAFRRGPASAPAARLLDAGCGTGGLIRRLSRSAPRRSWSGIDLSPVACELARRRTDAEIREASITEIPFADGTFDGVASADVLCQIPSPERGLAELHRVLKPGGTVAVNLPAYAWLFSYHDVQVHNLRRYHRREVTALLEAAGFIGVRATYWNALPFPLAVVKRKLFRPAAGTSDVERPPRLLDLAFRGLMALEQGWLAAGGRWAWGLSVFATARKR